MPKKKKMNEKPEKTEAPTKFIDIKAPDKTAPSATSRPIIVTHATLGADPMVNAEPSAPAQTDKPAEPMTRTVKTIEPMSDALKPSGTDVADEATDTDPKTDSPQPDPTPSEPAAPDKPAFPDTDEAVSNPPLTARDAEATSQADEAKQVAQAEAETARQAQLEQLIDSGKYTAPINAHKRARSRALAGVLCVVAVVLAFVVFDAALDAGLVQVNGVPHTDFLKDK